MHGSYARHILEENAAARRKHELENPFPQPVPCAPVTEQPQATQPTKEKDDVA